MCVFCSEIWCHGDLLSAVQDARLFNDSKTFVDMNLKTDPGENISTHCRHNVKGVTAKQKKRNQGRIQKFQKGVSLRLS
jgi:neutral trehalase